MARIDPRRQERSGRDYRREASVRFGAGKAAEGSDIGRGCVGTALTLHLYTPGTPLSMFVDVMWLLEGPPPHHAKERALPTGTVELVIDLSGDPLRSYDGRDSRRFEHLASPLVCGAHSEFFIIDTAAPAGIIGVHFKPGGAFPFLGVPVDELHNLQASLEWLWGQAARDLQDRLMEAPTVGGRFACLKQALLSVLCGVRPHRAVTYALHRFQSAAAEGSIAEVVAEVGLSQRRFIQVFCKQVGLTPKRFCRVQRFQQALRCIGMRETVDWLDVALGCGYFDQAHFIHEFRAFTGLTPTAYLAQRSGRLNHVVLTG